MILYLQIFIFFGLILALGFLKDLIAFYFQGLSLIIFRSRLPGIILYSVFFLPGVIIHELSHLFTAEFLRVRTGQIHIFPQEIHGGQVRMGSVETEESDPFRQTLIGVAPFFWGLSILFGLTFYMFINSEFIITPLNLILLYLIFSISNTMFSSKEDRRGWWFIPILLIAIVSFLYIFQINLNFEKILNSLNKFLQVINFSLMVCLFLDIISFLLLKLLVNFFSGLFHTRLVVTKK